MQIGSVAYNLTLFCDASFCPNTKVAGWGAWAKRMEWVEGALFGGAFKSVFDNNHEAELCAIANALFVLKEQGHLAGITQVMVQSDTARSPVTPSARGKRAATCIWPSR